VAIYPAYEGACAFVLSLVLVTVAIELKHDLLGLLVGIIGLGLSWWLLSNAIDTAASSAADNDRRCWRIEREMLSAHPRRTDLPDVFTALGCRPQTRLLIAFPSRPA
jgi:hypothetical protein